MKILITGGAGLVGSHCAEFYALKGNEVIVLDNLMRSSLFGYDKKSVEYNWNYLKKYENVKRIKGDVREEKDVLEAIGDGVDAVIHTAGQPGVPLSVRIPKEDFSINAFGTLNVLECIRKVCPSAAVVYCSTNKVYGENVDLIPLEEKERRYIYKNVVGVSEKLPIDLTGHTPYGASKYVGDIYTQEYGHIYGMKTAVFRMSCVAGDTKIATPQGLIKISDREKVETEVYCFQNKLDLKTTEGSFTTPNLGKQLYRLRTKRGYEIEATGDHKFYTPAGYTVLDSIHYGSLVAMCPEFFHTRRKHTGQLPKQVILSKKKFILQLKKYGRRLTSNLKYVNNLEKLGLLPLSYNNPKIYILARLVGYITGDGHLYFRYRPNGKSYTEIQIYGSKEELENVRTDFMRLGFAPGKICSSCSSSKLSTGHIIKGTSLRLGVTTTDAFAFFELLGVPVGNKSRVTFQVPKWIISGPRDVQDQYLSGLFGAEMSAPLFFSRRGQVKREIQPSCFSQSKTECLHRNLHLFRKQITGMLRERNIKTRTYIMETKFFSKKDGQKSICFNLVLRASRENILNFAKIGFAYNDERKLQLLRMAEFLKANLPYSHYDAWEKEHTHLLGNSGLFWDRIIYKKQIAMKEIFDITVPGHHNFFANGFLVHNCTYGVRQFGFEDQGWVAWFVIANLLNKPITIYGNGKQVRDLLYASDLIRAFDKFIESDLRQVVFNIGGGAHNTTSLLEFLDEIKKVTGKNMEMDFSDWRPSDQKVYISDISRVKEILNWQPEISPAQGIEKLVKWVSDNRSIFE